MIKELICISCPIGCRLSVDTEKLTVTGNSCKRGETYGINEVTNPVRVITTTVKIQGGTHSVLPVKTNAPIPKDLNFKCIEEINKVTLKAPVRIGEIICSNILNTGVDVIATRNLDRE
jgi:CxxC motif-containing protein